MWSQFVNYVDGKVKNFFSKETDVFHQNAQSSGALIRPDYTAGKGNFVAKSQILECS
jgi:hypothetical protein